MDPSPPNTPPVDGLQRLVADIIAISQEVRAFNKRPLPATEDQVKALVMLTERNRELVVQVFSAQVAEQLLGKAEKHEQAQQQAFQQLQDEFIRQINQTRKDISQELVTQEDSMKKVAGLVGEAAELVGTTAKTFPTFVAVRGDVHGFTNDTSVKICAGVCLVVGLLLGVLVSWGLRGGVSKDVFDEMTTAATNSRTAAAKNLVQNQGLGESIHFLKGQIGRYRAKHPKTTDFPPER